VEIMHPSAARVQAELVSLGAVGTVVELEASTRTAEEAAAAIGTTVARIAKSLVFLAGEEPVLVIASGIHRISVPRLASYLGQAVKRADADAVRRLTGFPIGGVPPVGHSRPSRVLIERGLLDQPEIWAAAGTPHAVFRTVPEELVRITAGEVVDVREDSQAGERS
jgi:prolyl-tRNA editing enzyme YbaK/EbsC (Cys-tRNA(Pro) deacylase)